jgi:hypothetical protein
MGSALREQQHGYFVRAPIAGVHVEARQRNRWALDDVSFEHACA